MSGRRRYERFSTGQPFEGRLRVLHDVTVVGVGDDQTLELIGPLPGVAGEVVLLDLAGHRTVVSLVACVTDSRLVMMDGAVSHALRLLILDETRRPEPARGALEQRPPVTRHGVLEAEDLVAVIIRETDVHVVNVSSSGCLVETGAPVQEGTTATLTLRAGDEDFSDAVRVVRCSARKGAKPRHLVGVEFLWTTVPGPFSVRRAASGWCRSAVLPDVMISGSEPTLLM